MLQQLHALESLRSETEWQRLWDQAVQLAESLQITITPVRLRRHRQIPSSLSHSVIDTTTGVRNQAANYRTSVYYTSLDTLLGELNNRFSETNLSLLRSLQSLVPTSNSFLQVSSLYFLFFITMTVTWMMSHQRLHCYKFLKKSISSLLYTPCLRSVFLIYCRPFK